MGGRLVECTWEVDPVLEAAEIQRRVYASGGPAVFYPRVQGCRFPMVSNLFGSLEQARYLFRHTWDHVKRLVELKVDPTRALRSPLKYWRAPLTALKMLPRAVRRGAVQDHAITLSDLPKLVSWSADGGPFVTLPQVLSRCRQERGLQAINLGMYRVQISGNDYAADECGLHYQLRRGIGVHHREAQSRGETLPVTITVGGHPAMTLAAVMPLPEGLSELTFAGALSGRRIPMIDPVSHQRRGLSDASSYAPVYADADFAIVGEIDPVATKPEGPFGDHLGYYSLQHPFPFLKVKHVWHRTGAVWPFTVVGRPPQEDTTFGALIHELTGPVIPTVLPGVSAVHAVDVAGVHPLLLAIGSERCMPFMKLEQPQELLKQAHAILGNGQLALAKYLFILNKYDAPELDIHHVDEFLEHLLSRADWQRDLHFETRSSIDTLDYSGEGLNKGSKLVIAAVGPARYPLLDEVTGDLQLPDGWRNPRLVLPGVLAIEGPPRFRDSTSIDDADRMKACLLQWNSGQQATPTDGESERLAETLNALPIDTALNRYRLIILCDDSDFTSRSLANFLWVTFTRSQPATDVHGIHARVVHKHWGCRGALVIDARIKPWHVPAMTVDREVAAKVDAMAARGGPLAKYL